jgi:hypothetical protein
MRKILLVSTVIILLGLLLSWMWWSNNKNSFLKNKIETSISNATNQLYDIKYDSSYIDEVNGNAGFYNIKLKPDSTKKLNDENVVIEIAVAKLEILGIDIKEYISNKNVIGKTLNLINPQINIKINKEDNQSKLSKNDTLALYKKIIGNLKGINVNQINIVDGNLSIKKIKNSVDIEAINIKIDSFLIDSSRDYNNIISNFINDVKANVKKITLDNKINQTQILFSNIEYNAKNKYFKIDTLRQQNKKLGKTTLLLTKNIVSGISTDAFIYSQQIKAESISSIGGKVDLYLKDKLQNQNKNEEKQKDFFADAIINKINVGNTNLNVYKPEDYTKPAYVFNQLKFNATNIKTIQAGDDLLSYGLQLQWQLSGANFKLPTKNGEYNIALGNFVVDNYDKNINISSVSIKPVLSEAAFAANLKTQKDRYDLNFKNVVIKNFDLEAMIKSNHVIADEIILSPSILIFNDKTVPENLVSKVGKYPHQMLQNLALKLNIKKLSIINGYVSYREKAQKTKQIGNVFFNQLNGNIYNVTNINNANMPNYMEVKVTANFLGAAKIFTQWQLPIKNPTSNFTITSQIQQFDATKLNSITVPLGMAKIDKGIINKYNFSLSGNDYKASGKGTMLYDNLKVTLLKQAEGEPELKTKKGISVIANTFIKNSNLSNGNIREAKLEADRVLHKSFFNLVWKTIFSGAKSSVK